MGNSRQAFERSLLVGRVAGTFTQKEWESHKKEHPGANPADHTITKGDKSKGKSKAPTPHSLRDTGDAAAKAGKHDEAFAQYSAAAELFRRQRSPEAAASMDAAAKEQAKKWEKSRRTSSKLSSEP